jgi:hypothetical protein
MISLRSSLALLLGLVSLPQQQRQPALAHAQVVQDVAWEHGTPEWRRTKRVIDLSPLQILLGGPGDATSAPTDLARARKKVEQAIAESAVLNAARYARPARDRYYRGGAGAGETVAPPPLLDITDELADAAALVSEAETVGALKGDASEQAASPGTFWMQHVARKSLATDEAGSEYSVFRNVMDYGAKGDNLTVGISSSMPSNNSTLPDSGLTSYH